MTFLIKKAPKVSRRAMLRGAGIALGLPWLEAMLPTSASAQSAGVPVRSLFIYFPTGYKNGNWLKASAGVYPDWTFPATAQALSPFKSQLTFVTGAGNAPAAFGNGGDGIHARGTGCFLTCEHLLKTGFEVGISADQWDPLESTCRHASLSIL